MYRQKVIILRSKAFVFPFEKPLDQFIFGGETLLERLKRQLTHAGIEFTLDEKSTDQETRIEANFVASDSFWKFFSKGEVPENIECTYNSVLTNLHSLLQTQRVPFGFGSGLLKQEDLLTVHSGLPRAIYGGEHFVCRFPSVFFQPIQNWVELIKASSLVGREKTSESILKFRPWVGQKLLDRIVQHPVLSSKFNKIGRHSRIHPTSRLEGCQVGDHVEIGPYCYLRASVIGHRVTIREHSSIKASVIGSGCFLASADLFNTYLGDGCSIFTSMLHNSCLGDNCFIGGASGFSDFNAMASSIRLSATQELNLQESKTQATQKVSEPFLGSAVGEGSFIGAGLIFQSGLAIPARTKILNGEMISKLGSAAGKIYVSHNGRLTSLPQSFLRQGEANA